MSLLKINELPIHEEHGEFIEMAVIDPDGVTRRVYFEDKIFLSKKEAIFRIDDIFADGDAVLIIRYKP